MRGFVPLVCAVACAACTSDLDSFVTTPGVATATGASASGESSTSTAATSASGSSSTEGSGGAGGSGASATGGVGQGGAGGAALPCSPGNSYKLTDDFDDGVIAAEWTPSAIGVGAAVYETGGQLQFASGNSIGAYNNYAVYVAGPFDLRGCSVLVHAVMLPVDDVQTFIAFGINSFADAVAIGADQGTISLCVATGNQSDCDDLPHMGGGDDWWRIREEGGILKLETAPDGKTWTTRRELPTPGYAAAGDVELGMGSFDPVDFSYAGAFDEFNLPPP